MALTFIDTNKLPKRRTNGAGEVTEVLNQALCGAKNVLGSLRWLGDVDTYTAEASGKHQLIYIMDGKGSIALNGREHAVETGGGIYLGPSESAAFRATSGATMKLLQLVVPKIPK
jgi:AraC-like ligand binding domain